MVYKGNSKFRSNKKDLDSWAKKGYYPKVIDKKAKKEIEKKLKEQGKGLKEVKVDADVKPEKKEEKEDK